MRLAAETQQLGTCTYGSLLGGGGKERELRDPMGVPGFKLDGDRSECGVLPEANRREEP